MKIKMIVVDLDDTLLRNDKTVSERTVGALKKCREKGIKVVYATARGQSAQVLVSSDLFDGYVIMNGAIARAGAQVVYSRLISSVSVRKMLLAADDAGIPIAVQSAGMDYTNFDTTKVWEWVKHFTISDFRTLDVESEKIYALPKTESEIDILKKHLPRGLYLITTREDNFTMIMNEDASKEKAVAALAGHWGICVSDVVAFGDDIIDIEMIKNCGVGVAMGNAISELKAVADYVCDTNENDGIAKWLEGNLLLLIDK